MWFVPNCSSIPSSVNDFLQRITPALFISMFTWSSSEKQICISDYNNAFICVTYIKEIAN